MATALMMVLTEGGKCMRLRYWAPFCLFLCVRGALSAHIQTPEGSEDIPLLARSATFVFHAQVLSIATVHGKDAFFLPNVANLAVDRWYKGAPGPATVRLKYLYPPLIRGSDCIDLRRASSWLIFAKQTADGTYEF